MSDLNTPNPEGKPSEPQNDAASSGDPPPDKVETSASASADIPQQNPPPPHIMFVIMHLSADNLKAAFGRTAGDIQAFIDRSEIANKYNFLFLYDEQSSISEKTSNAL